MTQTATKRQSSQHSQQTTQTPQSKRQLERFGSFRGHPDGNGYTFTLTAPLAAALESAGVETVFPDDADEDALPGVTAGVAFNDPVPVLGGEGSVVTGVVTHGDDVKGGRTFLNQRRVSVNGRSLHLRLPGEIVEVLDGGEPPIIEVWAGDGAIAFKPLGTGDAEITGGISGYPLAKLPDPIRRDVLAVTGGTESLTPSDAAREHIDRAAEILGGVAELQTAVSTPGQYVGTAEVTAAADGSNTLTITRAVKTALQTSDAVIEAEDAGAIATFDPNKGGQGVVPTQIETGEDADIDDGLTRVIDTSPTPADTQRHQVRLPNSVLSELGIDPDEADRERVVLLASTDQSAIALTQPITETRVITEPTLQKRYVDADEE
jgi:hypothetical protein